MLLIKKYKGIRKENILNLFENLNDRINKTLEKTKKEKIIKPSNIYEDELNLAKKLDAIEEYTIERFEENIVVLENREKLSISGVLDVLSFDDQVVIVETELGLLTIKGENLRINKLSIDTSEVVVEGDIFNLSYSEKSADKKGGSLIGKIFK